MKLLSTGPGHYSGGRRTIASPAASPVAQQRVFRQDQHTAPLERAGAAAAARTEQAAAPRGLEWLAGGLRPHRDAARNPDDVVHRRVGVVDAAIFDAQLHALMARSQAGEIHEVARQRAEAIDRRRGQHRIAVVASEITPPQRFGIHTIYRASRYRYRLRNDDQYRLARNRHVVHFEIVIAGTVDVGVHGICSRAAFTATQPADILRADEGRAATNRTRDVSEPQRQAG